MEPLRGAPQANSKRFEDKQAEVIVMAKLRQLGEEVGEVEEAADQEVAKLEAAGIETHIVNGSSVYFAGPDGERLELLSYPLHDMYGTVVG